MHPDFRVARVKRRKMDCPEEPADPELITQDPEDPAEMVEPELMAQQRFKLILILGL